MQDVILRQSPADQQHYRATGVWPDETFADVLRARTAVHPDREAVTDGKTRLTYRQLEDAIIRVADLLARSGIRPGDIVAVQLPNWIEFIPAYFAIERIGAIGVPVSIEFRAREVDYVLRTTGARGIITCAEYKKFDHQGQDALISVALRDSRLRKRSGDMSDLFWLTDAQMARLAPFFPRSHGKPRVDDRRVLSGIIFINRNGLRWRDAPAAYGPHKTLYSRWKRWSEKGIFARMMAGLAAGHGEKTTVMIDATYLKVHRTATSMAAKKGGVVA